MQNWLQALEGGLASVLANGVPVLSRLPPLPSASWKLDSGPGAVRDSGLSSMSLSLLSDELSPPHFTPEGAQDVFGSHLAEPEGQGPGAAGWAHPPPRPLYSSPGSVSTVLAILLEEDDNTSQLSFPLH